MKRKPVSLSPVANKRRFLRPFWSQAMIEVDNMDTQVSAVMVEMFLHSS